MAHFLSSFASVCITAQRSSCQNACSERRSLCCGSTKDWFIGNIRDNLAPKIVLRAAAHCNIALHRLPQRFFHHAQPAQILFEGHSLQDGSVKMRQSMETSPANNNTASKRIPIRAKHAIPIGNDYQTGVAGRHRTGCLIIRMLKLVKILTRLAGNLFHKPGNSITTAEWNLSVPRVCSRNGRSSRALSSIQRMPLING